MQSSSSSASSKRPKVRPVSGSSSGKPSDGQKPQKGPVREWVDAFVYAGIAAMIIRTFILELFVIPTSSMERSLLVGDFLFVSKFHYGTRLPMVPLAVPFIHNRLPYTNTKSYLDWIVFPYARLPGLTSIERNDVVVFNYPADDIHPNNRELGPVRIPSMKENYIKRCVAVPGDTIEIRDDQVFIDGRPGQNPPGMQFRYSVFTQGNPLPGKALKEMGYRPQGDSNENIGVMGSAYWMLMTEENRRRIEQWSMVTEIRRHPHTRVSDNELAMIYPNSIYTTPRAQLTGAARPHTPFRWTIANFGPLVVPRAGVPLTLNAGNIHLYRRVIETYEGHRLELNNNRVLIDGREVRSYTPEMDYYFMMGDNRHNSQDSRFWGFVPENHVVGKPLFVFFSMEGGISGLRWDRFFMGIE